MPFLKNLSCIDEQMSLISLSELFPGDHLHNSNLYFYRFIGIFKLIWYRWLNYLLHFLEKNIQWKISKYLMLLLNTSRRSMSSSSYNFSFPGQISLASLSDFLPLNSSRMFTFLLVINTNIPLLWVLKRFGCLLLKSPFSQ